MTDSGAHSGPLDTTKSRARRAVIDCLKFYGAQTAQAVSGHLAVTAMAVRQHLYELHEEGLVSFDEVQNGLGRPAKVWTLTAGANSFFPDGHADLAVGLIHTVRAVFGEEGIDKLIALRTAAQLKAYGRALEKADSIQSRLEALADVRTNEGYMADVQAEDDGSFTFMERHCPICAAAQACSGLCASELDVFRQTLGPAVTVERTDHILAGAKRCAYKVCPKINRRAGG